MRLVKKYSPTEIVISFRESAIEIGITDYFSNGDRDRDRDRDHDLNF